MRLTRKQLIMLLVLALLLLVGTDIFGSWLAPFLGDADHHLQHYLLRPLLRIGRLPVTALLVTKLAMLMVALMLSANFMTQFLQKHS